MSVEGVFVLIEVQWQRFPSFQPAIQALDQSLTAHVIAGRFLVHSLAEYVDMADARVDIPAFQPALIGPASHQADPQPLAGPGDGASVAGIVVAGLHRAPDAKLVAIAEDRLVAEDQGKH